MKQQDHPIDAAVFTRYTAALAKLSPPGIGQEFHTHSFGVAIMGVQAGLDDNL